MRSTGWRKFCYWLRSLFGNTYKANDRVFIVESSEFGGRCHVGTGRVVSLRRDGRYLVKPDCWNDAIHNTNLILEGWKIEKMY